MFDVFRFAWFAVRTFLGVIALVLVLYVALWLFVKVLSAAPGNNAPGKESRVGQSGSAQTTGRDSTSPAVPLGHPSGCSETRSSGCSR